MDTYSGLLPVNIGSGHEISIAELAESISEVVGYKGVIEWDRSKPDGTPNRRLENSVLRTLGWCPSVSLERGLELTYDDFISQQIGPSRIYDNAR
jgi:GDP-L-fucose synthase